MKKTLVLVIVALIHFSSLSQTNATSTSIVEKQSLLDTDLIEKEGKMRADEIVIYYENAEEKLTPAKTSVFIDVEVFKEKNLTVALINKMLEESNVRALVSTKSKYTYVIREISMYYYKEKDCWSIGVRFTAQNSFGAITDGKCIINYDFLGNYLKSYNY